MLTFNVNLCLILAATRFPCLIRLRFSAMNWLRLFSVRDTDQKKARLVGHSQEDV